MNKFEQQIMPGKQKNDADEALLARLRAGEPQAFTEFVTNLGPRLLSSARRILRNEEDARDATQEAFAKAFSALEGFEGRSSLATWLYRILVNQCLMMLRKKRRHKEVALDALMPEFDIDQCRVEPMWQLSKSVDELIEQKHVRDTIHAAIERLPEKARIVLLLRDIEELSTIEVAEFLEISEGSVKVRLHRARAALKKLLEPIFGIQDSAVGEG